MPIPGRYEMEMMRRDNQRDREQMASLRRDDDDDSIQRLRDALFGSVSAAAETTVTTSDTVTYGTIRGVRRNMANTASVTSYEPYAKTYTQAYEYESFRSILEKLLHLNKDTYEKIVKKSKNENSTLENIVVEILKNYFNPTTEDNAATAMNKKLGFDKSIIPMVNYDEKDFIPF